MLVQSNATDRETTTTASGAVILIRLYVGLIFIVEGVLKYVRPGRWTHTTRRRAKRQVTNR